MKLSLLLVALLHGVGDLSNQTGFGLIGAGMDVSNLNVNVTCSNTKSRSGEFGITDGCYKDTLFVSLRDGYDLAGSVYRP